MIQATEDIGTMKGSVNRTPTLRNRLYGISRTLQFKGPKASISHYSQRAIQILLGRTEPEIQSEPTAPDERFAQGDFDARFGDLVIQSQNAKWGLPYVPTHQKFFDKALRSLPVRFQDYDFVDLGAGKGLALLLAAEYSFNSITGVEYSKIFADAASKNIAAYQQEHGTDALVKCVWGDAADFEFSERPTILYLFNPFQGKVMDRVIANLEASLRKKPRDLWVIYGIPWEGRKFRRSPLLETIEWSSEHSIHRSICR